MAPASIPTLFAGILTCWVIEKYKLFGYGAELPAGVRQILLDEDRRLRANHKPIDRMLLITQVIVAILMVLALAFHVAEIGLIGLAVKPKSAGISLSSSSRWHLPAYPPCLPVS